jgi:hypothetical protein
MSFSFMVGAPGPLALPPRGGTIEVLCVNGGHSRISVIASQGAPHARFFPPRDILPLSDRRSQTSGNASQGGHYEQE